MKKKLVLLLAAAMVAGSLAGCGNDSGNNDSGGANALPEGDMDPRFKYEEPVTLTSYFEISPTIAADWNQETTLNSVYYQRMTEETNISIDWQWFAAQTADDSEQKKSVAIASGEIPDFMIVNSSQLSLLAKTDLINRNIGRIFEKYASEELMSWTTGEGQAALESASYGGEVIAIPLVDSSVDTLPMLWIRRDWIEKLNLEMPKTMDDLYNVMVAFRDQDPDGNGQADTIGMVLHNNFLSAGFGDAVGVFNGFGAYPGIWVKDGEDKLRYGSIMEENKAALEYLAKMYQEGLVDQDFSSNDEVKASEAAASGRAGIQYGLMWNANWPLNTTVQNDPEADWVTLPLPSATGTDALPQTSPRITGYVVVNKNCEHPEAVVRLLNFWVDKYAYSGDEYNDYLVTDSNGTLNFPLHWVMLKTWFPLKNLTIHQHIVEALEKNDASSLNAEEMVSYNDIQKYLSGDIATSYGGMKTFGNDMSAFDTIQHYYEDNVFIMNEFTTGPTPTMGQKMSTVTDKVSEYYTKVIMGIESVDNFDKFVEEVNALGLDKITEELNEWYAGK
ncbi:MAG: extracellular solute-binding protein [Lachnospiraceae bacterium]|nr:extracellular solute-binding protein [uncultured Acetatifactor sp.]MCI9218462.1 extracellular solute-binding protein [Lachnospiraceae bacterium]